MSVQVLSGDAVLLRPSVLESWWFRERMQVVRVVERFDGP
jgi:hypothetical protein